MLPAFANWSVVTQENILVFKSLKKEKGGESQLSDSCISQTLFHPSLYEEEATNLCRFMSTVTQ